MSQYRFVEPWPTDSPIDWWNEGRTKLNKIINVYNDWQKDGFDEDQGVRVKAEIIYGMQTFALRDGGSDWYKELEGMLGFVEGKLNEG